MRKNKITTSEAIQHLMQMTDVWTQRSVGCQAAMDAARALQREMPQHAGTLKAIWSYERVALMACECKEQSQWEQAKAKSDELSKTISKLLDRE